MSALRFNPMGLVFPLLLTSIMIGLKLTGVVDWSNWIIWSPMLASIVITTLTVIKSAASNS